jgi:phage gpG-like protein
MKADIKIEVAKAVADFRLYAARATNEIEKTVMQYALIVEKTAKECFKVRGDESVYNEPPRVDTGRLRASITHRSMRENGIFSAEIGTNVEYAADVEYGTSNTMPHPFMSYALGMYQKEIEDAIGQAVKDANNA